MKWELQLQEYTKEIEKELEKYLTVQDGKNNTLIDAMQYSVHAGGKRLRPVLALGAYELFDDKADLILPYACALEFIHTYSLIHDDLPAMDNDDYRRGKLTNHKVFGEGIAILAGDGLLNYSFEVMFDHALKQPNMYPYVRAMREIALAAGVRGMIGGQLVDLESENKTIDGETLHYIHMNKTAALIAAPLKVGAIIGGANEEDIERMGKIGAYLGLAFQIQDDILDIVGDAEKLGKPVGSDESNHKSTYPSIYGLEEAYAKVKALTDEVNSLLDHYKGRKNYEFLYELSNYLVNREH